MVTNWLEQAREQGIANARDPEKNIGSNPYYHRLPRPEVTQVRYTDAFDAELVTPEQVNEFLNQYLAPILALLHDLNTYSSDQENLDFIVDPPVNEYLHMGDVDNLRGKSFRAQYALAKTNTELRGSTDYSVAVNYCYGRQYTVSHWTKQHFANIKLLPRTNAETHLAGVEYQVANIYSEVATEPAKAIDALPGLQISIAALYTYYIEKQARYFGW